MGVKAIITGATGMVGEGVLLECLGSPDVEEVLVINRKPVGRTHPKLRELLLPDFFDLAPLQGRLGAYDACFFCLGMSSVGMSKDEYKRQTYDLTLGFAQALARERPDATFCYVTGAGTDSTEQGRSAWARVKGATENVLLRLFPNAYMFRPGAMKAVPGQRHVPTFYRALLWLYPLGRMIYPKGFCTLAEVGQAMIHAATRGYPTRVLEVKDIGELAKPS